MKYSKLLFRLRPVSGHGPLLNWHPRLIKIMPLSLQTSDHFLLPPDNFIHFYFLLQFLTAPVQALKNCPRPSQVTFQSLRPLFVSFAKYLKWKLVHLPTKPVERQLKFIARLPASAPNTSDSRRSFAKC